MPIAALYVETDGCYSGLPGVDPWDEERDARLYPGPYPVVAHPPCQLWVNLTGVNYKRYGGAHNRPAWGEGNSHAKLTVPKVLDIRARYAAGGITQQALADEHGVSQGAVNSIVHRRSWRRLPE